MQAYEQKPIPLIIRNSQKKYEVNPQALSFFNSLQGKVAIISVAGIYRTGKSFLLNKMILNSPTGFAVGPTTNAKTKGIWVWGKPIISHNQNDQIINVIVLDSQGLGSTQQDINHDLKLFSVTLLMSSAFLYNTVGSIDQNAIDSLGLVLRLCQNLKSQNYNDFPEFYWILRDFSLALVDKDGNALTTKQYLESCLSQQPGDSQVRNRIRKSIKQSFMDRYCLTFVRPLTDENQLQKLDKMQLDQLRPEFVQQVIDFRKLIFQSLKTKTIKGKQIKGSMLSDLITLYVNEINSDKIPVIQTGWKYVCLKECQNAMQQVQKQLGHKLSSMAGKLPQTKAEFMQKKEQIQKHMLKTFIQRTKNNDQHEQFLSDLKTMINRSFIKLQVQMINKNTQQTKNFIRKQFQSIQKKLKSGQFSNIAQLAKQFQLFYEYFRKKCPYKDHFQVGLQYLMKKFADCGLIVFKSMKNKKQHEISNLKEQALKLSNELISKQQKHKSQKQKLTDRLTISQSTLNNLQHQNKQYLSSMVQLQVLIEKLTSQAEQLKLNRQSEGEMEKITLKKRVMVLQDELKELQCSKGLEFNNLKNSLMLKENEISHLNEQIMMLSSKLDNASAEMSKIKLEKSKSIQGLTSQVEGLRQQELVRVKLFQQKMRQKNGEIGKLQQCVQAKCGQIQALRSEKAASSQQVLEQLQRQRQQMKGKYQCQITTLGQAKSNIQEQLKLTSARLQQEAQQKQMDLKMSRMEIQKQKAIFQQKIQFLRREIDEKDQRVSKLQKQNRYYLEMFEGKDDEIEGLKNDLENLRLTHENSSEEIESKLTEYTQQLKQRNRDILGKEKRIEQVEQKLRQMQTQHESLVQKHEKLALYNQQSTRNFKGKLQQAESEVQEQKQRYESQLISLKQENSKNLEEQKRNIELSIIQLKNYYEMEKQRLEKKILEERNKFEYSEDEIAQGYEEKMKDQQRRHSEEENLLRNQMETLEDQLSRLQNEYQSRVNSDQEQTQNQMKILVSKYEILDKKYNDSVEEYNGLQTQTKQDRISFIKKIEQLNFQLSRKQKETLQAASKRESLEGNLVKKQLQIQNIKKIMNQEIENSLKKIQETNVKYQKLNEEYLQFKIYSQKELALSRQRNDFLNSKLAEMQREREIGSSKNLEKIEKLKVTEMKEQIEKLKSDNLTLEAKAQTTRKEHSLNESAMRKQVQQLEKQLQHQKQRLNLQRTKSGDMQQKISSKNQVFKKQLESIKEKYQSERNEHYRLIQELKEKNTALQDQKNNVSWRLQKEVALLNDKVQYAQRQREEAKRDVEEVETRVMLLTSQLKKTSQKSSQESESKGKSQQDQRRINQQLETMKSSMKCKSDQQEQENRKLREQLKSLKQRNIQMKQRLYKTQKSKKLEKSLQEDNQSLRLQKEQLEAKNKAERLKELDQWRKRLADIQKLNKQLMNENNVYIFQLEKNQSKWLMEKNSLLEKQAALEDQLVWIRNSGELQRVSSHTRLDSSKRSDISSKYSTSGGFK